MKMYVTALSCLVFALTGTMAASPTQRALLIGINTYQPAGTRAEHPAGCIYGRCELGSFRESGRRGERCAGDGGPADESQVWISGEPSDAADQSRATPASHRGDCFAGTETDRAGILAAMQKYLVDEPQRGDTVVFYDASHGSLRVNSKGTKLTILSGGKYVHADSTLVPV